MAIIQNCPDIIQLPCPHQIVIEQFLEDFRETIVSATARLRDILRKQSRQRSSADDWAPIEVLGHLIDSAANNHQRFVRAQFTDDLVFPGYEQDQWVSSQKYRDESWPDLIQLWSSYNLHLVHVVSVIPGRRLNQTARSSHVSTRSRSIWWTKMNRPHSNT